jgi:hypothetical protein
MKYGAFRGNLTRIDQFLSFQAALLAETHRADVPTAITFDAFGKFLHPGLETTAQVQAVDFSDRTLGAPLHLFPCHEFIRVGTQTLAGLGQFTGAGNPNRNNLVRLQLAPGKQGLEASLITTAYQDTEGLLRITAGKVYELLIEGIPAVSGLIQVPHHKVVKIILFTKEAGPDLAVLLAKA